MSAQQFLAPTEVRPANQPKITRLEALSESGPVASAFPSQDQINRPAVEALLLGIRLRGWITDREKEILDRLAPDRSVTFLICQEQCLHPEGVELFPFELIETAVRKGGDAVFTHRYQRTSRDTNYHYTIYTAVIDGSGNDHLVLGFFGPDDHMRSPDTESKFHKLASLFRYVHNHQCQFADKLRQRLACDTPTIVVNRGSGRIIALNQAATRLLNEDTRSLVDREYGEVKAQLVSVLPGRKLTMTNINEDELYLTTISVTSAEGSDDGKISDTEDKTLRKIQFGLNELSRISKNLETLGDRIKSHEAVALSQQLIEVIDEVFFYRTHLGHLITSASASQPPGAK